MLQIHHNPMRDLVEAGERSPWEYIDPVEYFGEAAMAGEATYWEEADNGVMVHVFMTEPIECQRWPRLARYSAIRIVEDPDSEFGWRWATEDEGGGLV